MEATDRAARNSDETERKNLPGKHRAIAIHEAGEWRHEHLRAHQENSGRERKDGAGLDERAQIVTRRKQQPNRKRRSRKAVSDDRKRQRESAEGEFAGERRR